MEELNNCLIVFEILGLQYFSLKTLFKEDAKRPSWLRFFYMIFALIASITIIRNYGDFSGAGLLKSVQEKTMIALSVQNIMVMAFMVVISVSIIHAYKTTNEYKQIFIISSKIIRISSEAFGKSLDVKTLKKKLFKRIRSMVIFFIVFHSLMFVFDPLSSPVAVVFSALKNLILLMLSFRLVVCTSLVNEHLNFLEVMVDKMFPSPPIKIIDNINLHLTYVKSATLKDKPLKKIMAAREVYSHTLEISNLVNNTVGLSIFLLFVSLVIAMTSGGHRLFVASMGGPGGDNMYGEHRC